MIRSISIPRFCYQFGHHSKIKQIPVLLFILIRIAIFYNQIMHSLRQNQALPITQDLKITKKNLNMGDQEFISLLSKQETQKATVLNVFRNRITMLSCQLWKCSHLKVLYVHNNRITSISQGMQKLIELTQLYMHHNQIEEIPFSISKLPKIKIINVSYNKIKAFPPFMFKISQLKKFDVSQNKITEIPLSLGEMQEQLQVDVRENPLSKKAINLCCMLNSKGFKLKYMQELQQKSDY